MKYTESCLESYKTYFRKVYLVYGDDYNGWNYKRGPWIEGAHELGSGWVDWLHHNEYVDNGSRKFTQKFIDEVVNDSL